jgi:hypothetical protein
VKYGHCWLRDYELGDRVEWGGNDSGPAQGKVVLSGIVEDPCSRCGNDEWDVDVLVEDGEFLSVGNIGTLPTTSTRS